MKKTLCCALAGSMLGAIVFAATLLVTWPLAERSGNISLRSLLPGMKRVRSA
ncbi:MAG: hypothetical protein HC937_03880 [Aquincola sp.]|nr:hypothetical protein [Aquincola sp.]